jgi:DNA repair exonuclease SbcCD ATPase subunit
MSNIRKSKNHEDMPDFDEMWGDVQEEIQEKDAEDAVVNRASELKQLSIDIDKATTAVINAKLSLESSIRQTQREEGVLGAAVNAISGKVDTINKHIDQVMKDAPTKLKVTVTVCDTDWQKMQELHAQWMEQEKQMLADQHKQQEALWQKQSHRLSEIVKNNEGVWLSQRLFYIIGSLSLLSIFTIVLEIAFYVYFHWCI